jgi:hypothetical protein
MPATRRRGTVPPAPSLDGVVAGPRDEGTGRVKGALAAAVAAGPLVWALRLMAVQAVGLAGLVCVLLYEDLAGSADSARGAWAVTLFTVLMTAVLGLLSLALRRRRGWARGPAIVLELLFLPIGYSMALGGLPWLGIPLIAAGLGGAGALLVPATRAALGMK